MSPSAAQDCEDLEALFDSIADQRVAAMTQGEPSAFSQPAAGAEEPVNAGGPVMASVDPGPINGSEVLFDRVGRLTRSLHDALVELGYDKAMEKVVDALPDARDRLTYISNLTQSAAERALGAVEEAMPIQREMANGARELRASWDGVFDGTCAPGDFRALALATYSFLKTLPERTELTEKKLLDVMMAQDFHDLTGQVIKKIVDLAHTVEKELLALLVAAQPEERTTGSEQQVLNGPVVRGEDRADIVTSQQQVDDLLGQLGF